MFTKEFLHEAKSRIRHNWKLFAAFLVPIILSPMVWGIHEFQSSGSTLDPNKKFRTAYVITIMAIFWIFEVIPLAITSLLPIVLFPLLRVQHAATVSKNYMKESNMIFLGAIILALGIEYSGVHIRVALRVIRMCGANPYRVMFGVMIIAAMLSLWISDTSTTTMLLPIVSAITSAMFHEEQVEIIQQIQANQIQGNTGEFYEQSSVRRESLIFVNSSLQRDFPRNRKISINAQVANRSNSVSNGGPRLNTNNVISTITDSGLFLDEMPREENVIHNDGLNGSVKKQSLEARLSGSSSSSSFINVSSMSIIEEGVAVPASGTEIKASAEPEEQIQRDIEAGQGDMGSGIDDEDAKKFQSNIRKMLLFAVGYAANIGGTGSLIGTGPIKVFKELAKTYKLEKSNDLIGITFLTWMGFNIPPLLVNILIAWLFLILRYFNPRQSNESNKYLKDSAKIKQYLDTEYEKLGPMSQHQYGVSAVFILVVILWLLRDPQLFDGWDALDKTTDTGDSTAAMLGVVLLFIIPKDWSFLTCRKTPYTPKAKYEALLDWKFVSANAPWGYILLIGSGYAIADASYTSGLSEAIGKELELLGQLHHIVLLMIVLIITCILTEVVSNTACANLILPLLFSVSCRLDIHPIYLTMPSAVAASYAFMLPISSPPNAIIFATGEIPLWEMLWNGLILNICCVTVLFVAVITYGEVFFKFSEFDSYANKLPNFNCSGGP